MPCTVWCARTPFVVRESYGDVTDMIAHVNAFHVAPRWIEVTMRSGESTMLNVEQISSVSPVVPAPREETR